MPLPSLCNTDPHLHIHNFTPTTPMSTQPHGYEPPPDPSTPTSATPAAAARSRWANLSHWDGVKPSPLIICVILGVILRFAVPKPQEVSHQAWSLLAIFIVTVAGLILSPLPVGSWAFACLTLAVVTKTLTFAAAFAAFTNEVIWLIIISFFLSKGFVKTGLGDRVAMFFVRLLGKRTLSLSYGLALGELIISLGMPSSTARAGGIFLPIIKSLSLAAESKPNHPSSRKLGAFLIQSQNQCCNNTSALFLTAAAQNLLCIKLAESLGVEVPNRWITWLKASVVPSLVGLAATPYVLYKIYPPEIKNTPEAPSMAKEKLKQMGSIKRNEWIMIAALLLTIALWVAGEAINMSSVVAAMLGLTLLLLAGVIDWEDCLAEKQAWDTLVWFGVLIGMATQLTTLGVTPWMSKCVAQFMKSLSLNWFGAFSLLQLAYFFIHYLFAGQTAQVGALYSAFLGMHLASKVPGLLSALALAYNTNLFGALTHYSSGQAAVYYGAGYLKLRDVFTVGFAMAVFNLVVWALFGAAWWKIVGLY